MESIVAFVQLYVTVQLLGAAVFPLGHAVLRRLPDRGYCLAKSAGILLVGLVAWLGNAYGLLRNEAGGWWLAVAGVALLAAWAGTPLAGCRDWLASNRRLVLVAEVLFLLAFAVWMGVRHVDPAVHHTEQPMDLMLLNAMNANPAFPPEDPWLAGYPVAYYYFGYWLMNGVGRLAGVAPDVRYNALQACWFALLVLGSFGAGYDVCRTYVTRGTPGRRGSGRAVLAGLLAAVSVAVAGNLRLIGELAAAGGGWADRIRAVLAGDGWWRASRVVQDRSADGAAIELITEFPAFSYVLGDNHPHVLAMPFLLIVIGLALDLALADEDAPRGAGVGRLRLAACGIVSGGFLFLNAWDYPLALGLLVACRFAARRRGGARLARATAGAAAFAAALVAIAAVTYFPYLLTAQSQVRGVAANTSQATPLSGLIIMFGAFLPGCGALLVTAWRRRPPPVARWVGGIALLVVAAAIVLAAFGGLDALRHPGRRLGSAFGLGVVALAVCGAVLVEHDGARPERSRDPATGFAVLLAAAGFAAVLVPEIVYVLDVFGTRMNTVFKFWYQGWLLLAIVSSCGIAAGSRRRPLPALLAAAGLLLTVLAASYPALALSSKTWGRAERGLPSVLAQLERRAADEARAVAWIRRHVPVDARVVEGEGRSYHPEDNRISTYTGRPTLLGWVGHEVQWRGGDFGAMAAGRSEALDAIYRTGSAATVAATLARWGVDYVYVGPVERSRYGVAEAREQVLRQVMDPVFASGSVRIYRARGELRP